MTRVVLFTTYTILDPSVGGWFFRALCLACVMYRRGRSPAICNSGPMLDDPKRDQARGAVRFIQLDRHVPGFKKWVACRQFASLEPDVIVMGESPLSVERFWPFVSLGETPEQQRTRVAKWLHSSPFA